MQGYHSRIRSIFLVALVAMGVLYPLGSVFSEPVIDPTYGMPRPPTSIPIPEECKKSPEDIIDEINKGIDKIPTCSEKSLIPRPLCCSMAIALSKSGCDKVLDTAMKCCRLRFPVWIPPRAVEFTCQQMMYQLGITEASEYCRKESAERLNQVGCLQPPVVAQDEADTDN
jgi:hypothetical protein